MGKKPVLYLICLGILFFGKTSAQVSINTGLAAYYPFNHSVKDESGNGNHPSAFSISYTTDRFGKPNAACKFNGQTNFIRIPDANSLHFKKGMTISAWVKVEGFYSGECHGNRIIMKGSSDYLDGNFFLTYDDNHYTNGSNCYTSKPDQVHQTFYGPATKPLGKTYVVKGTWYLLTYTYDGNNAILYANCDIVASGKKRNYDFTNYDDLMFGRMENNKFPYWFNGVLDEVRIYNRALNADEVKALCNLQQSSAKPVTDPCDGAGKPSAKFDYTITDCNTVNFRLLTVKNNTIKSVKWFFGDGTTSAETKPTHIYSRFGSFKVKAIVTSKQGCSDTVIKEIKLAGLNTDFVVSEKGEPGMVTFKAKNNKATYAWDFADGSTATNESLISHSYNASGLFTVRMFAKNLVGCTDTVAKNVYILLPKPDSVKESVTETTISNPSSLPQVTLKFEKREKDIIRTIPVKNDSLFIALYDNGIIDGDSVTILFNNQVLVSKQILNEKPVRMAIKVDRNNPSNEVVMYADNLGSIPPNTALMVVNDGEERHTIIISSTHKTNGAVAFIRRD